MSIESTREPWEELDEILAARDVKRLSAYLKALGPEETARVVSRLHEEGQTELLALIDPEEAATLLRELPDSQAAELLEDLAPNAAAAIVNELPSDDQVDFLGQLDAGEAEAILERMEPEEALDVRSRSPYAPESAGGLMITEYLVYPESASVSDVLQDLRDNSEEYRSYDVQYGYIISAGGGLVGVLRLRDLLLAPREAPVKDLMLPNPLRVSTRAPLDELEHFFDRHSFYGVPVVDPLERLVGVVRRAAVEEALGERAGQNLLKFSGIVGGEEFRTMPLFRRASRRLSWLSINIVLNVVAASVIALYQDTLSAVIALAVFLPILSDMSGCSGNQAVAVSLRELALGLVRPDELARVLGKEAGVGVINGLVLGLLLGGVAWAWKGNPLLGLVVGGALALNTLVAVCFGGGVPLLLRRLGLDPALASGPILTTVTDMCGFFLALSFATAALPWLT